MAVDKNGDNPEEAVVFDLGGGEAAGVARFAAAIVSRREMPISSRLAQQLRQLGDIHRDPPRLMRQPLGFTFQPWIDALTYSSGVANLHYSSAGRFYSIDLPGARPSN